MPPLSSSSDTPTISRPLDLCLVDSSWSLGKDFLHGSHHVAQKSTITTLPFNLPRLTLPWPFIESPSKDGAGVPWRGCLPPAPLVAPPPALELLQPPNGSDTDMASAATTVCLMANLFTMGNGSHTSRSTASS